jgi:hypothetical protein
MKIFLRLLLVAVVFAAGVWVWRALHPSPEKAIRKQFAELADCVSFTEDDGNFAHLAAADKIGGFFAPEVVIVLDVARGPEAIHGRDEIRDAVNASRRLFGSMDVEFSGFNVLLAEGNKSAQVGVTARAVIPEQDVMVHELKCLLKETNGNWVITRIETVKVLH